MKQPQMIAVDELAMFMNIGWPGEDWYLSDHADYLWESTFTTGGPGEIYQPRRPGTFINLRDFEARVRWQGIGRDPKGGAGYRLTELFSLWRRQFQDVTVVAFVPREKLAFVIAQLEKAGCMLPNAEAPLLPAYSDDTASD